MVMERDLVIDVDSNNRAKVGISSFEVEDTITSDTNSVKTNDEYDDIESSITYKFEDEKREHMPLIDKKTQKHRSRNSKKPPRPRKGPSLTTSDLRLVKEISELVIKKRARIERLKSMKKVRAARPSSSSSSSSSNTSIVAMVFTLLFFIIILLQGFGSGKSSTLSFGETHEPLARTSVLVSDPNFTVHRVSRKLVVLGPKITVQ